MVGNAGTALYGRMDMDELATPGYSTLSPAIKIKLATLPKGELMVRHPHFTQPIFVRFPRPAVMSGRDGVERFPPEPDLPFASAVGRQLRQLGATVSDDTVADRIDGRREPDVRQAVHATRRARPDAPWPFFLSCLGRVIEPEVVQPRRAIPSVMRHDDPYAP